MSDPRYAHWQQQSQMYGTYGQAHLQHVFNQNAWQAMQFQSEDEFTAVFRHYQSETLNGIQAHELQTIMNGVPRIRNYYRIDWSLELCKIMIMMLDRNRDGIMQYAEFRELLQCLIYWHQLFCKYDRDQSGFVEANEMVAVFLQSFGYVLSKAAVTCLLKRYSRAMDDGRCLLAFDDFTAMCVRLRAYTEAFRARDRQTHPHGETGRYEFSYDDFIQCTMCL